MSAKRKDASLFDQLRSGLEDSIGYSKGELSLRTTELPAPPPAVSPRQVRSLRESLHMSQAVFAATLNVSTKTVQSWEQGRREPSDAALRLIQIVRRDPAVVTAAGGATAKSARTQPTRKRGHRLAKGKRASSKQGRHSRLR